MLLEPYNSRLSKRKKFRSLREVLLDIISKSTYWLTPDQVLERTTNYFLPFQPSISNINKLLQKLAKFNLIEFVYLDMAYGVKITEKGKQEIKLLYN